MKIILNIYLILSFLIISLEGTFQTDIFIELNSNKKGENLIISPLSIYQVLSLLANGANGETQSEMLKTLGSNTLDELNDINYKILSNSASFSTIYLANAIMARQKHYRPAATSVSQSQPMLHEHYSHVLLAVVPSLHYNREKASELL